MRDNPAFVPDDMDEPDFSIINLEDKSKEKKVPRRVIHFSDGVLEEYSTDEDEAERVASPQPIVDPSTLTWGPWLWNRLATSSEKTLAAVDYCGEKLAGFLGILNSRYQFAIDEYERDKREDELERRERACEMEAVHSRELKEVEKMEGGEPHIKFVSNGDVAMSEVTMPLKVDPLPVSEQI